MPLFVTIQASWPPSLAMLALATYFTGAINSSKPQGYGKKQDGYTKKVAAHSAANVCLLQK